MHTNPRKIISIKLENDSLIFFFFFCIHVNDDTVSKEKFDVKIHSLTGLTFGSKVKLFSAMNYQGLYVLKMKAKTFPKIV